VLQLAHANKTAEKTETIRRLEPALADEMALVKVHLLVDVIDPVKELA